MLQRSVGSDEVGTGMAVKVGTAVETCVQLFGPQAQGCCKFTTVLEIQPPSTGVPMKLT